MSLKIVSSTALAGAAFAVIALTGASGSYAAQARTIACKDGTTVTVGDAEDLRGACLGHKGVSPGQAARSSATGAKRSFKQSGATQTAYPDNNVAKAWTAACYAEFGPDAKWPDGKLLDYCLSY